jgi:phosphohistidine phosphatase
MGELIRDRIGMPDAIVSSDAHRARQTAEIAAEAMGFESGIGLEHAIYEAWLPDLIEVVQSLPAGAGSAAIVGHNPGFEALVVALAGLDPTEVRLPTAGLAHLELDIATWVEVGPNAGRLAALYTPKAIGS